MLLYGSPFIYKLATHAPCLVLHPTTLSFSLRVAFTRADAFTDPQPNDSCPNASANDTKSNNSSSDSPCLRVRFYHQQRVSVRRQHNQMAA
jgi:hypothetical protein